MADTRRDLSAPPGYDVVVAGGGPAGLSAAIAAAMRGLRVAVCERRTLPIDKACGEGLMPPAVRALDEIGARGLIDRKGCARLDGVRLIEQRGRAVQGIFPEPGGLGVRRLVLSEALARRAREAGVEIRDGCAVTGYRTEKRRIIAETSHGRIAAEVLVAADGLQSRLRKLASLELPARGPRRFGIRRHFRIPPWSRFVEVYIAGRMEAYVTPVAADIVGVAILWEEVVPSDRVSFERMLRKFPILADRLAAAPAASRSRGAGPMLQRVRGAVAHRFVLAGDAAGYIDAITGEGLSLALASGLALGNILPRAIEQGATCRALREYERVVSRRFRRYAISTRAVLTASRYPLVHRGSMAVLRSFPRLFELAMKWAFADESPANAVSRQSFIPAGARDHDEPLVGVR